MRVAILGSLRVGHTAVYARYLRDAGHSVVVLGDGECGETGIDAVALEPSVTHPSFGSLPMLWRRLQGMRHYLKSQDFDVINAHYVGTDAVLSAVASGTPIVLSFYGSDIHRLGSASPMLRLAMRWVIRRAAAIHSVSDFMTQEIRRYGGDAARMKTFQYGVNLSLFALEPTPREGKTILSTRALTPFYRVETIIRSMPHILAKEPAACLRVAGQGPERSTLEAIAEELGVVARVEFLGHLDHATLANELRRAAVWVSLPSTDGAPLSLLEAMACGAIPVVADYPALREWFSAMSGVFIEHVDPEEVADATILAFDLASDRECLLRNRATVEERGDQSKNLARFERMLINACGCSVTDGGAS